MSEVAYSIGAKSVTIMKDGDIHMLDDTDQRFTKIKALLQKKKPDIDKALKMMDLQTAVERSSAGRVSIGPEGVTFEGREVGGYMAERLAAMAGSGMDVKPWMHFMDNLQENPQDDIREDIFRWMEAGKMPITEDGCIVAFKKVRGDFKDVHSGKFDNSVGAVVAMPREQCDMNRHQTCSTGLHFCSADYLSQFVGQRVMVVKIDPRDVTAIPTDYNNSKGRCCRYEVTGELSSESAARHKVFDEPVMPVDPQEIPDLMAKTTTPGKAKPRTKGPESPIGKKGASRKVASNAATAKRKGLSTPAKASTKAKTSKSKPKRSATSAAAKTVKKVTKAATKATKKVSKAAGKIITGLEEAVVDAVSPIPKKAKRTTAKVPASKAPAKSASKKTKRPATSTKGKTKRPATKSTAKTKAPATKSTPRAKAPVKAKKTATKSRSRKK